MMQRGNPNLLKSIQQSAKRVSEARELQTGTVSVVPQPAQIRYPEAGAFASMQKMNQSVQNTPKIASVNTESDKRLKDRLLESVETLGVTKEYFNAASSLFTLYALGEITEGLMKSISKEDMDEIKGIIREFKGIIESY